MRVPARTRHTARSPILQRPCMHVVASICICNCICKQGACMPPPTCPVCHALAFNYFLLSLTDRPNQRGIRVASSILGVGIRACTACLVVLQSWSSPFKPLAFDFLGQGQQIPRRQGLAGPCCTTTNRPMERLLRTAEALLSFVLPAQDHAPVIWCLLNHIYTL